ncbi:hypothetical protein N9N67_06325 [Bacteriovoracaceae bacterium]|nr:hypothetical protein [Bacteriovoracaceae bacterium]
MAKGNRSSDDDSNSPPTRSVNKLKNEFKLDQVHPCRTRSCQNTNLSISEYNQIKQDLIDQHQNFKGHINQIYPHAEIKIHQYNPKVTADSPGKIDFEHNCLFSKKSNLELLTGEFLENNLTLNSKKRFTEAGSLERSDFCQSKLATVQTQPEIDINLKVKLEDDYLLKFIKNLYYINEDSFKFKKISMDGKDYLELTLNQNKKRSEVCVTHQNPRICYLLDNVTKQLVIMIDLNNTLPFPGLYFSHYTAYQDESLLDFTYEIRE